MTRRPLLRCATALSIALAAAVVGTTAPAAAAPRPGSVPDTSITVMTRNLYLGGDIGRPLAAVAAALRAGGNPLLALAHENHALRGTVDETDFPARSKLLANEIASTRPDLIGLQEVALWRSDELQLNMIGVANADDPATALDFLQILLDDLAVAGETYVVVHEQVESDVEGPAFTGSPFDGTMMNGRDVRLTMRDVLLKRADSHVRVEASGGGQYDARLPLSLAGLTYTFVRGYNWADIRSGAKRLRVINTHLESQLSVLADAQARELLAGPAAAPGRSVVVVCDCNSDPLDGSVKSGDVPHWTAYRTLTGTGGFEDGWQQLGTTDPGWTSGLSERVNDTPEQALERFDHRIDLVLTRGPGASEIAVDSGGVVGTDPGNRTTSGLWPSDHAGVVLTVRP